MVQPYPVKLFRPNRNAVPAGGRRLEFAIMLPKSHEVRDFHLAQDVDGALSLTLVLIYNFPGLWFGMDAAADGTEHGNACEDRNRG